jgi:hypothetical protein
MLQVARLAPNVLGDATPLVVEFLQSQRHPAGGFVNRSGLSDLYYTVFGIDGLVALQQPLPVEELHRYVTAFGNGDELDFIHLTCLARCWSVLPAEMHGEMPVRALLSRLETYRTPDGGYDTLPGKLRGSLYGTFMAFGAYQDLRQPIPNPNRLAEFIRGLRDPCGAFRQSLALPVALVPATAGAVALLRQLGEESLDPDIGRWFLSCFDEQGGFRPAPAAPVPDLLSTATALHALAALKIDLGARKELCLDFIDTLWTNRGGFYGHWEDSHVDCEYTYYALLSLGHLSL